MAEMAKQTDGDWEMRDGKWYRKEVFTTERHAEPTQVIHQTHVVQSCQECPKHIERILSMTREVDDLRRLLGERDTLVAELRLRLERSDVDSKSWLMERRTIEQRVRELEAHSKDRADWVSPMFLKEKETIIYNLNERIKVLLTDKETLNTKCVKLEESLKSMEKQTAICQEKGFLCNCKELPAPATVMISQQSVVQELSPVAAAAATLVVQQPPSPVAPVVLAPTPIPFAVPATLVQTAQSTATTTTSATTVMGNVSERWYYEVREPAHAQLFAQNMAYKGGQILIDALEGATVVNPEYYSSSEHVPGMSRLRIRIVDYKPTAPFNQANEELFVRLKMGEATQFTQPQPLTYMGAVWNQDMVFVEVPLKQHPIETTAQVSAHNLIVEVVSRVVGSVEEKVTGSVTIDLSDTLHNVTRLVPVPLGTAGVLNLRIKALDFGLAPTGAIAQELSKTTVTNIIQPNLLPGTVIAGASPAATAATTVFAVPAATGAMVGTVFRAPSPQPVVVGQEGLIQMQMVQQQQQQQVIGGVQLSPVMAPIAAVVATSPIPPMEIATEQQTVTTTTTTTEVAATSQSSADAAATAAAAEAEAAAKAAAAEAEAVALKEEEIRRQQQIAEEAQALIAAVGARPSGSIAETLSRVDKTLREHEAEAIGIGIRARFCAPAISSEIEGELADKTFSTMPVLDRVDRLLAGKLNFPL